tara:strand:+ start:3016 stop:3426 length:411 start_codon:yes stop_codon:yes gene_type:complete
MSFVRTPLKDSGSHFLLEMMPNPEVRVTAEQSAAQQEVISKIHDAGADLFRPNPAVDINGQLKSRQLYNRQVKVSELLSAMNQYDLVMRAHLKGEQSACAQFLPEQLTAGATESPTGAFSLGKRGNYIASLDFATR